MGVLWWCGGLGDSRRGAKAKSKVRCWRVKKRWNGYIFGVSIVLVVWDGGGMGDGKSFRVVG